MIKLNGIDLTSYTHQEVTDLFCQAIPICKMTVYRESLEENEEYENYEYREGLLK